MVPCGSAYMLPVPGSVVFVSVLPCDVVVYDELGVPFICGSATLENEIGEFDCGLGAGCGTTLVVSTSGIIDIGL